MEPRNLYINQVFIEKTERDFRTIRIIHLGQKKVFFVDINYDKKSEMSTQRVASLPDYVSREDFLIKWESGDLELTSDPFHTFFDEDELVTVYNLYLNKRDENYRIASYIWEKKREEFLLPRYRSRLIKDVSSRFMRSEQSVRWIIKRFLQRGMTKNALVPDYFNCGNKGRSNEDYYKKRGRKATRNINGEVIQGIRVTKDVREKILKGYKKYYLKSSEDSTKVWAYEQMLKEFFSVKVIENGVSKLKLIPGTYPLIDTFYYHIRQNADKLGEAGRNGKKHLENNVKQKAGSSLKRCSGPGSIYQIDSTYLPVALVSTLNPEKYIGKAIYYQVKDVYSRLICGFHIGVENASYSALMMALTNTVEDKTSLLEEYGFKDARWPCSHLPETIVVDNGSEYTGYKIENLINNLGVHVRYAPPYSPTKKGMVESGLKTLKQKLANLPGRLPRLRLRGDKDTRLNAVLTIEGLTEIVIAHILNQNASVINGYDGDKSIWKYDVPPTPNDLWAHGIEKVGGARKVYDYDFIFNNLLPKATASITKKGILYDTRYYISDKILEEEWYTTHKGEKLNISYDPRNVTEISVLLDRGNERIKCSLPSDSPWINLSQDECRSLRSDRESKNKFIKHQEFERRMNIHLRTDQIVAESKKQSRGKITKSSLKEIRVSRALEKKYWWYKQTTDIAIKQNSSIDEQKLYPETSSGFLFINRFSEV